jgi:hypothetical protein
MEKQTETEKKIEVTTEERARLQALEGTIISAKLALADSVFTLFSGVDRVQSAQRVLRDAVLGVGQQHGVNGENGQKWDYDIRSGVFTVR